MAKRFTDTELWDKEWFMKLSPKLKCLVKLVRDKADLAGVWSPNWVLANSYIGEQVSETELLNIDEGNQFAKLENGKIICVDFIQFQYGKLSPASPVHRKIISILATHKIDYQYPINRVQEEDKEEDKEEEEEKEEEKFIEKQIQNGKKGGRPKTQKEPKENPSLNPNHNPNKSLYGTEIETGIGIVSFGKSENLLLKIKDFAVEIENSYSKIEAAARRNKTSPDVIKSMIPDFVDVCITKSKDEDTWYNYCNYFSNWLANEFSKQKNSTQKKSPHKLDTINYNEKF